VTEKLAATVLINKQTMQETGETEAVTSDTENSSYNYLEPPPEPPRAREIKHSPSMPFPMIFRRSKKDPGSKQYNALVKELEQVLEKRNNVKRSHSMRHDLDMEDVPEIRGTLRGTKLSSSTDNLSVFSNKALLSRLENHFKNRMHPGAGADKSKEEETSITVVGGGGFHSESNGVVVSVESAHVHSMHVQSSTTWNGHSVKTHADGHSPLTVTTNSNGFTSPSHHHNHQPAVSVVRVSSVSHAESSSTNSHSYRVGSSGSHNSLSPTSPQALNSPTSEDESFSQEMSFGSEEDFSLMVGSLPNHGHYRKHQSGGGMRGHGHFHRTNTTDFAYKARTLDSSFKHITRIAVSKSAENLPSAVSGSQQQVLTMKPYYDHQHHQSVNMNGSENGTSPHWPMLPRTNSVPMKTIVEQYSETDAADVPTWNEALRSTKRHKEKGMYRSLSQRMVQKIYRFVRPSSKNNSVGRSSSFSLGQNSTAPQRQSSNTLNTSLGAEDLVVEFPNKYRASSSQPNISISTQRNGLEGRDGVSLVGNAYSYGSRDSTDSSTTHMNGGLRVLLPNSHTASIIPSFSPQTFPGADPTQQRFTTVSRTHSVGTSVYGPSHRLSSTHHHLASSSESALTVQLPNNHTAAIVHSLPGGSLVIGGSGGGGGVGYNVVNNSTSHQKVSRSASHRQTYRPPEEGKCNNK
jgi:hypothetical protein